MLCIITFSINAANFLSYSTPGCQAPASSTLFGLFEEVADADTKQTAKLEGME